MVVNSVSFRTGLKFQNHISDHKRLRDISDAICREHGKAVIENAPFYDSQKKAYWLRKAGKTTHRDALKSDVDLAISHSRGRSEFIYYMQSLGYTFERDFRFEYPSVRHITWKKLVRLNSLGSDYSAEAILKRLDRNYQNSMFKPFFSPPRNRRPLLVFFSKYDEYKKKDLVTIIFELFIQIIKICTGNNVEEEKRLYSPSFRAEWKYLDSIMDDYRFLINKQIQTMPELSEYKTVVTKQIENYETERQKLRNRIRRASPEDSTVLKEQCKEITQKLKPLRDDVKRCDRIKERYERIHALMKEELELETGAREKEARNR